MYIFLGFIVFCTSQSKKVVTKEDIIGRLYLNNVVKEILEAFGSTKKGQPFRYPSQFSKHLSICPSVCVSVRLFVRVFTFEVPFKHLFALTSRMSNIFRDLESSGKSNGKK